MSTYTTCRDCKETLLVTDNETVHPHCTPRPTKAERLAAQWVAAVEDGDHDLEKRLADEIDEIDRRPPRMLDAALRYASWGWAVFPLRPGSKAPATRNGFKDASTDEDTIRDWWTANPAYNVGLPTGGAFDVIDIDVPDGVQSYMHICDDGLIPDIHGQVSTSSGGWHLYIVRTGDGNGCRIMPGIDYRGRGGYVVAPPSTLGAKDRAWSWITAPSPIITKNESQSW